MYSQLRGIIVEAELEKDALVCAIDVNGVGYEVLMPRASEGKFNQGQLLTLYISESVTAYDGATTLYGFLTKEEKKFFNRIRDHVGGMGPKKALECIDKISRSLPDFRRAVLDNDIRLLVSVFGFTKKTAEKLVFSLKNKIEGWSVAGQAKWAGVTGSSAESDAVSGLLNLGYRDNEARETVAQAKTKLKKTAGTEEILQESLRILSARVSSS